MYATLSILLAVGYPLLSRLMVRRGWLPAWSASIVACYAIGILVANLRLWPIDGPLMESVAGGSMLLGLPLLLFAVRIRESLRYARSMLFSFALCCISGLAATTLATAWLHDRIPDAWKAAGMVTGLYTGGTPNVQAIGLALDAPADYLILIQSADVLLGGSILLGLLSFLPGLYGRFLPHAYPDGGADAGAMTAEAEGMEASSPVLPGKRHPLQLAAAVAVVLLSVIVCKLVTGAWVDTTVIVLILTTISLGVTLTPLIERIGNSYPLGEYFVLVFCVALGLLADFRLLMASGLELLYFSAIAIVVTTLLHLLLSALFRIDRDTVILSYVAALYGPVFVAQVAASIGNKRLLASGIAVSLIGFGIGNYLGVGVALLLQTLTG